MVTESERKQAVMALDDAAAELRHNLEEISAAAGVSEDQIMVNIEEIESLLQAVQQKDEDEYDASDF